VREPVVLSINGAEQRLSVDPQRTLLEVLRDDLGLTGAKYGCGEGQCGACTVLLDGKAVRSCTLPVASAADKAVRTIEGLAGGDRLHPVQQAFLDAGALQCGYCTPGMIMAAVALLERAPRDGGGFADAEVAAALQGNICRCGTYPRVVAAVVAAARQPQGAGR
jgi:aerobic-type carbon monoxide dehydrogenase small subunit (CoxS/CutS family)